MCVSDATEASCMKFFHSFLECISNTNNLYVHVEYRVFFSCVFFSEPASCFIPFLASFLPFFEGMIVKSEKMKNGNSGEEEKRLA